MISRAWEGVGLSQDLSEHDNKSVRMCWYRRNVAACSFLEVLCFKCCKQCVVFLTEFAAAPASSVWVDRCKRSWAVLPQSGPALGPAGWWLPANTRPALGLQCTCCGRFGNLGCFSQLALKAGVSLCPYVGLLACMVLLFLYLECCLWIIKSAQGRESMLVVCHCCFYLRSRAAPQTSNESLNTEWVRTPLSLPWEKQGSGS